MKNNITNENCQKEGNRIVKTPSKQLKSAFDAERKIISAKHSQ